MYYNIHMEKQYKRTKTTVSSIQYHLVFCPRYRRKIFNIPGVEARFKKLAAEECARRGIDIIAMECHVDHVHMFVSAYPQQSIPDIVKWVKGATSKSLREEFPQLEKMPSLWTRSYFVGAAGEVSASTIEWYVKTQKTRY